MLLACSLLKVTLPAQNITYVECFVHNEGWSFISYTKVFQLTFQLNSCENFQNIFLIFGSCNFYKETYLIYFARIKFCEFSTFNLLPYLLFENKKNVYKANQTLDFQELKIQSFFRELSLANL